MTPCYLYRLYATDGSLLYVGITSNLTRRMSDHRLRQPWWHEVAHTNTTCLPDRTVALRAESRAIRDEDPRYNLAGKDYERPPAMRPLQRVSAEEMQALLVQTVAAQLAHVITEATARKHRANRNRIIRELRAEDSDLWTYSALAKAVGITPELAAAIVKGRTR